MNHRTIAVQCCAIVTVSCAAPRPLMPAERGTVVAVPEEAHCKSSSTFPASQNCCVMEPYVTPSQVDRAYAAAVAEYGFSVEPAPYDAEAEANPDLDHGHAHESHPGDAYVLSGIVVPRSSPALFRGVWLGLRLRRVPHDFTEVQPVYCQHAGQAMEQQVAWHRAVQDSIRSTLPPKAGRP